MPNYHYFPAKTTARFNLVIVHGMQEHSGRYQAFAEYLADLGGNIITFDLPAHGAEKKPDQLGDFGESGLTRAFSDIEHFFQQFNNDLPNILFGHSMGSTIALRYAEHYKNLNLLILCGLPTNPMVALHAGYYAAKLERLIRPQRPSLLSAIFKTYNAAFKPTQTDFDWLSANPDNVQRYIADPLCGYAIAPQYFVEMFDMMRQTFSKPALQQLDPALKIAVVWGADDPVTQFGKGTRQFVRQLQTRHATVISHEYTGLRHEILHELEQAHVYQDVAQFIQTHL